jgi:hypothetical protein
MASQLTSRQTAIVREYARTFGGSGTAAFPAKATEDEKRFRLPAVSSSNLQSVGERDGDLYVRFNNGGYYRYPAAGELAAKIRNAGSAGKEFYKLVRKPDLAFARLRRGG